MKKLMIVNSIILMFSLSVLILSCQKLPTIQTGQVSNDLEQDSGAVAVGEACRHCPEWLADPLHVELGQMCISSAFIANQVTACALTLGDCSPNIVNSTPLDNECLNALHDQCDGPITECEYDHSW